MNRCDERTSDILFYVDNALSGQRLEGLRAHLESCSNCRQRLEDELALSSFLRKVRPLYLAPQALRARVAAAATEQPSVFSPAPDRSSKARMRA